VQPPGLGPRRRVDIGDQDLPRDPGRRELIERVAGHHDVER